MTGTHLPPFPQLLSRSLLMPGPQPPLSHLGATLLRHVIGTVVRYSLYQLGLPMPESPPVRILRLRVLLDATPLQQTLERRPAGAEVLEALLLPDGAGELEPEAGRVRAAAALHRARLAALGPRRARGRPAAGPVGGAAGAGSNQVRDEAAARAVGGAVAATPGGPERRPPAGLSPERERIWAGVTALVSGELPYLCDAALGELVTSLARRRLRHVGKTPGPALGQVAWLIHRGRDADLRALGPLDPLSPSWAEEGVDAGELGRRAALARADVRLPARSGRRGGFREAYRFVLSELRPLLLELGERATADGLVEAPDDVFFLPFDLGGELALLRRPTWLAAAVATNRREHAALRREPEHADRIEGPPALAPLGDRSAGWDLAPLLPVE